MRAMKLKIALFVTLLAVPTLTAQTQVIRIHAEGAFGRGGGEAQAPVHVRDHDHVGGVLDERGVARLDDARSALLAQQRVIAREHALSQHHEERQREDDDRHRGRRARHRAALDIDEHEEGHQHRDVGHPLHKGAAGGRRLLLLGGRAAQLFPRRGDKPGVAGQVDPVRHAAREIRAGDLGHGPDDVGIPGFVPK